ncbi:MAG: AlpA family phage regulatory protein [Pseudomonadota bacterium]
MHSLDQKIDRILQDLDLQRDETRPRYFSLQDLITLTGLGRTSIYRRCNDGTFPRPTKLGSRSFWKRDEFLSALERLETGGNSPKPKLQPVSGNVRRRSAPK